MLFLFGGCLDHPQLLITGKRREDMPQRQNILRLALEKFLWPSALAASAAGLVTLPAGNAAWAGPPQRGPNALGLFESIAVPPTGSNNTAGGLYSFDISWVDQATHRYYLADRSNN